MSEDVVLADLLQGVECTTEAGMFTNIIPRVPYYEPTILLMIEILHYLKDPKLLNYGNYGIFLIMGKAGFYITNRSLPKPCTNHCEAMFHPESPRPLN